MAQQRANYGQSLYKSPQEKRAYQLQLEGEIIDRTENRNDNFSKTNSSTVGNKEVQPEKIAGRPIKLRLLDFIKTNLGVNIIVGLTLAAVIGLIGAYNHIVTIQGIQESNIQRIDQEQQKSSDKITKLDKDFSVFKEGLSKDVEYIKNFLLPQNSK